MAQPTSIPYRNRGLSWSRMRISPISLTIFMLKAVGKPMIIPGKDIEQMSAHREEIAYLDQRKTSWA
jgi:hypothetical protein